MSNKVEVLVRLFETIEKRSNDDPSQSNTAQLLSEGKEKCIAKLKEESLETVEAAEKNEISQNHQRSSYQVMIISGSSNSYLTSSV